MQRLTPLAATFLQAEDEDSKASLAIGSFAIFAGPAPRFQDFLDLMSGRIPLIPRYRQKLRSVRWDLAAPAWVDDPDFNLRWHVRAVALPHPGGAAEIGELMSQVMARRMDRSRPLWEYWFCTGLADGRWAILSKLHHSVADGVSGTHLYELVLDPTPAARHPLDDLWQPAGTSAVEYVARTLGELALLPVHQVGLGLSALGSPIRSVGRLGRFSRGAATMSKALWPARSSSLTGPLSGNRRYAWASLRLADVDAIRKHFTCTVNDVALAALTGGYRRLLLGRGEQPEPSSVRSLVPVSTRRPEDAGTPDNRVSLLLPYLPVELPDAVDQLAAVHNRIGQLRGAHEPEAGGDLTALSEQLPFGPVALGIRTALRLPQQQITTVTTNVPGPPHQLYGLGRPLEQLLPYVPIADRVRVGVAITSYLDALTFGVTADAESTPDIDVLTRGIEATTTELLSACGSLR